MTPNPNPTPDDDPVLRETLKRCSPATYYAACKFRASGGLEHLRPIVVGVIERFVERDLRPKLQDAADAVDALKLTHDLGLDSLTLMEIVMIAEEVLPITISNEELTRLATVGDVHVFVASKLRATPPAAAVNGQESASAGRPDETPAIHRLPAHPNHA